jgi:hypothetical protein
MGAPATKIEGVTLTQVTPPFRMTHPGYPRTVDDGIIHRKGNTTNTVRLTIPGGNPSGGDLILEGARYSEWITKVMWRSVPVPDPEAEAIIKGKLLWTFDGGTFEGTVYRRITGMPISPSSVVYTRMVLHGTGDFRGQTIKLVDGEGYIIIPK